MQHSHLCPFLLLSLLYRPSLKLLFAVFLSLLLLSLFLPIVLLLYPSPRLFFFFSSNRSCRRNFETISTIILTNTSHSSIWNYSNLNFLPVRDLVKSILLTSTEIYQVASIRILKHYYILLHIFLL